MPISLSELKKNLHYDPSTGIFTRLLRASNMPAGSIAGSIQNRDGYVIIRVLGHRHTAHRLAWFYMTGFWPEGEIDHINRVRNDNRWTNLRDISHIENIHNCSPDKSAKSQNVYWDGRNGGRWYGAFRFRNKTYYAGSSRDRETALHLVEKMKFEVMGLAKSGSLKT